MILLPATRTRRHQPGAFALLALSVDHAPGIRNIHFCGIQCDHFEGCMKSIDTTYLPPIALDADGNRPLYRQIYEWFRGAILDGQLQGGQVVPSTRRLALHLRVSRAPVLVAFELLQAEGYFESRTGAKTRVTKALPKRIAAQNALRSLGAARPNRPPRNVSSQPISMIWNPDDPWWRLTGAFRVGVPDSRHFPFAVWASILARHARAPMSQTMSSMGYFPLRVAIADYLRIARGVRCVPEQIMIVGGAQHGLQLAARVLLDRGATALMEDPGYWGASGALRSVGARPAPVPVDQEGMDVAEGLRRYPDARVAYVTPAHQFPLGCTLSASRRLMLLDWAARNDGWILEDDYDSEFRFTGKPISALQSLDADSRVIYIGSFSKVVSPGLRIGYLVIPRELVSMFRAARQAVDLASPNLLQLTLTDFIRDGHFARHIRRLKQLYSTRRQTFTTAIGQHLGDRLEIVGTVAGLHLAGLLPPRVDDWRIARELCATGISAIPLSTCYLGHPPKSGLLLGYANVDTDRIEAATKSLATTLRRLIPGT